MPTTTSGPSAVRCIASSCWVHFRSISCKRCCNAPTATTTRCRILWECNGKQGFQHCNISYTYNDGFRIVLYPQRSRPLGPHHKSEPRLLSQRHRPEAAPSCHMALFKFSRLHSHRRFVAPKGQTKGDTSSKLTWFFVRELL